MACVEEKEKRDSKQTKTAKVGQNAKGCEGHNEAQSEAKS